MYSLLSLIIGFLLDLLFGDPRSVSHPVVWIGKLIAYAEKSLRKVFPASPIWERIAGTILWLIVASISYIVPYIILDACRRVNFWLYLIAESLMCWPILAVKSLRDESMKVFSSLQSQNIEQSRYNVSQIVGRDTAGLNREDIMRATVETVAENTADGVVAPIFYFLLGGVPLGFLYKAVNTMDSMLGYIEKPYKDFGMMPAKIDDVFNYVPARISANLMLMAGGILSMDVRNGFRIYFRDRRKHASPNSAQTESVAAGLLRIRLAGDAWYHGELHKKEYIGDALREISLSDIPRTCSLMFVTAIIAVIILGGIKFLLLSL